MSRRTWHVDHLDYVDEPMILSMAKYRQYEDRQPSSHEANVVSSHVRGTKRLHAPVIDLDFSHEYVPSTTPGHGHLYLNRPISRWRMFIMLWGLWVGGAIEQGFFFWSLRRGGTFVRRPGVQKTPAEHQTYTHGLLFKLRDRKSTVGPK